jgi:hypothetical protein
MLFEVRPPQLQSSELDFEFWKHQHRCPLCCSGLSKSIIQTHTVKKYFVPCYLIECEYCTRILDYNTIDLQDEACRQDYMYLQMQCRSHFNFTKLRLCLNLQGSYGIDFKPTREYMHASWRCYMVKQV